MNCLAFSIWSKKKRGETQNEGSGLTGWKGEKISNCRDGLSPWIFRTPRGEAHRFSLSRIKTYSEYELIDNAHFSCPILMKMAWFNLFLKKQSNKNHVVLFIGDDSKYFCSKGCTRESRNIWKKKKIDPVAPIHCTVGYKVYHIKHLLSLTKSMLLTSSIILQSQINSGIYFQGEGLRGKGRRHLQNRVHDHPNLGNWTAGDRAEHAYFVCGTKPPSGFRPMA